jgi:AraC-like DNA-binding protein
LIPPNASHQGADVYEGSGECYTILLDPEAENLLLLCEEGCADMRDTLLSNCGQIIHAGSQAFSLAAQCHQCMEQAQTPLYIASMLQSLLNCILFGGREPPQPEEAVARTMDWIAAHIEEKISLPQMCEELGIAVSTLQHKFLDATGEGLQQYIIRQKIMASLEVLRRNRNITDTALMFQFTQSGHYSRLFRKHMFVSPREWLAMHPKEDD